MKWLLSVLSIFITTAALATSEAPLKKLKLVEGDEQGNEVKAVKTELLVANSEKNAIAQVKILL
ncbi:MAG: hypothetical protein KDD22_02715, partial [Bdellovibrionales bacterium]|nr:hypothetical protein [Bdellovibrionales bacterium]